MLKLLGCLCILGAGAAVRTMQVRRLRRELALLRDMDSALDELRDEIRSSRSALPGLLDKAGKGRGGDASVFFEAAAAAIRTGNEFPLVWKQEADRLPASSDVRREVGELGQKLCGDEAAACDGISLVTDFLRKDIEEKRRCQRDTERCCTAMCFSGALLLILLLI